MKTLVGLIMLAMLGCASEKKPRLGPDFNDLSRAPGSAMTDEGMFFRKENQQPTENHWQFFYKHCLLDDNMNRDYGCNGPF